MRALVLTLILSACADDPTLIGSDNQPLPTQPTDVYLIMGQSNALGGAKSVDLPPELAFYADPYAAPWAQEFNCPTDGSSNPCQQSNSWEDDVHPRSGGYFGIELSAIRRLDERSSNVVGLLKHATNGTALYDDWDATAPTITLFDRAVSFIDTQMAILPSGSRIAGLFWIQGNGDAGTTIVAGDYAENLAFLALALRKEYGCVPLVVDRLHPLFTSKPYHQTIRDEQDTAAALVDDLVVVSTDDLVLRDGIQHYDAASFITLGLRMADAMALCP